ncbi:hypothetical protein [Actimicrobium sp. GrIS 1.19]|uniref:hypothetical protein n=1 Tax=Actimicrobium sp. GrIS 1.19 TaxID=3071708 RepID=UPI002E0FE802
MLRHAPSIDLYELNLIVNQLLADPARILEVRRQLHQGATVNFFDHRINALAPGRVIELRQKDLRIQDERTRTQWILPYTAVLIGPAQQGAPSTPVPPAQAPIPPSAFNLGDTVTFTDKYLHERVGTVIRINTKTLSVQCDDSTWRVTPRILRKLIDV